MSEVEAFMYVLGLLLADGTIPHTSPYSASLSFKASSEYSWALHLGGLYRLFLARFGISCTHKLEDQSYDPNHAPSHVWTSASTSLGVWIEKVLFGLPPQESASDALTTTLLDGQTPTKTYIPLDADWLLDMPTKWVARFVQGLADGDGSVVIPNQNCIITSYVNQRFIQRLLAKWEIGTRVHGLNVVTSGIDDVIKASKIPLFWGATEKASNLAMLAEWFEKRKRQKYGGEELEVLAEAISAGDWTMKQINEAVYNATSEQNGGKGWYRTPRGLTRKMKRMREERTALLREVMSKARTEEWSVDQICDMIERSSTVRLGYTWRPDKADIEREMSL